MNKVKIENVITDRQLQVMLLDLEKRWKKASEIKDKKKKFREIMRIRNEAKALLIASRRAKLLANSEKNNNGFFQKIIKSIVRWISSMEKRYK